MRAIPLILGVLAVVAASTCARADEPATSTLARHHVLLAVEGGLGVAPSLEHGVAGGLVLGVNVGAQLHRCAVGVRGVFLIGDGRGNGGTEEMFDSIVSVGAFAELEATRWLRIGVSPSWSYYDYRERGDGDPVSGNWITDRQGLGADLYASFAVARSNKGQLYFSPSLGYRYFFSATTYVGDVSEGRRPDVSFLLVSATVGYRF